MSNDTNTPAEFGYVTGHTAGGGTARHIIARKGDYFNGYAAAAICGTAPEGRWGTGSSAIRWTVDMNLTGEYGDTIYGTPAEAAAAVTVCRRCAAAAAKMAAATVTPEAAPVEAAAAPAEGVAVIRAEDVTPGTRVTGYSGSDPVTAIAAVAPGDIPGYTLITWSTEGGDTFTANVRNGDPVYTVAEAAPAESLDPADIRATELAVMSAPGAVRVDVSATLTGAYCRGAAAAVTAYWTGAPGRAECVDAVTVRVLGGHSHAGRVEAAETVLGQLQHVVSGPVTTGEYQTIARGSRDTIFIFGTWSN